MHMCKMVNVKGYLLQHYFVRAKNGNLPGTQKSPSYSIYLMEYCAVALFFYKGHFHIMVWKDLKDVTLENKGSGS